MNSCETDRRTDGRIAKMRPAHRAVRSQQFPKVYMSATDRFASDLAYVLKGKLYRIIMQLQILVGIVVCM